MSRLPPVFVFCLLALVGVRCMAQVPASGVSGAAILTQSLNVSGVGLNASLAFTANGSITYYWGGEQVQGSATLRARGHDQFRLDANLPEGTRSSCATMRSSPHLLPVLDFQDLPNLSPQFRQSKWFLDEAMTKGRRTQANCGPLGGP